MKKVYSFYKNNNEGMKWRSDDCAKNALEKSRSFRIVTDIYNFMHGHVSAVLTLSRPRGSPLTSKFVWR